MKPSHLEKGLIALGLTAGLGLAGCDKPNQSQQITAITEQTAAAASPEPTVPKVTKTLAGDPCPTLDDVERSCGPGPKEYKLRSIANPSILNRTLDCIDIRNAMSQRFGAFRECIDKNEEFKECSDAAIAEATEQKKNASPNHLYAAGRIESELIRTAMAAEPSRKKAGEMLFATYSATEDYNRIGCKSNGTIKVVKNKKLDDMPVGQFIGDIKTTFSTYLQTGKLKDPYP